MLRRAVRQLRDAAARGRVERGERDFVSGLGIEREQQRTDQRIEHRRKFLETSDLMPG